MTVQPLTVNEVVRYANHDFLNQLQLIQMNLDLNRVAEAKEIIVSYTTQCRTESNLNKLQLPKTVEWLLTAKWRFLALQLAITSDVDTSLDPIIDEALHEYLENTIIHVYDKLDPYTEQQLHIHIEAKMDRFRLLFHLQGQFEMTPFNKEVKELKVHTYEQTSTSWKYSIEHN